MNKMFVFIISNAMKLNIVPVQRDRFVLDHFCFFFLWQFYYNNNYILQAKSTLHSLFFLVKFPVKIHCQWVIL